MARDFHIRRDLQDIGLPERTIRVLEKVTLLIEALERLTATEGQISDVDDATTALDEALEDANLSITSLDGRVDALEVNAPYVSQDDTAAWTAATGTEARTALASYAGQAVSVGYVQAEAQATDDAVKAISQHLVALINDLKGNGTLT